MFAEVLPHHAGSDAVGIQITENVTLVERCILHGQHHLYVLQCLMPNGPHVEK
jgi:hypothetical protein